VVVFRGSLVRLLFEDVVYCVRIKEGGGKREEGR
jgi:hypothetical protein